MRTIACFGHSTCPTDFRQKLKKIVLSLYSEDSDTYFLIGHQGEFDSMIYSVLCSIEKINPSIQYKIVLAYMPAPSQEYAIFPPNRTLYPEGLEFVHPKFAITYRNRWMVRECDMVLCYITHDWGGAARFVKQAEKAGKQIINIAK